MSMQVCCVAPSIPILPPSDVDKMKAEMLKINNLMKAVEGRTATENTYQELEESVSILNGIILSLDNSNDFFKLGGFNQLLPLLGCSNGKVVAATAELIADLCQNNTFCQTKALEFRMLPALVQLLDQPLDSKVCSKALYAVSCLCRHNKEAVKNLEDTNIVPILLTILQDSDERLRARTAFFLSHLSDYENFRESLYKADIIGIFIKLLTEQDSSSEQILSALKEQVYKHVQSRVQCTDKEYNLKEVLQKKVKLYDAKEEYNEAKEYCENILVLCFPDERSPPC